MFDNEKDYNECLKEYDEIFLGNRKKFSTFLLNKDNGHRAIIVTLKYVFRKYMKWTPEQIEANLTYEIAKSMRIHTLIKKLPCPDELDCNQDLRYVAWALYPETRTLTDTELVQELYSNILSSKQKKFPKNYFDIQHGYDKARICFRHMLNNYFSTTFKNLEEMYSYFGGLEGKDAIRKYKLSNPLSELYPSVIDYFVDSLDEADQDEILYHKYGGRFEFMNDKDMAIDFGREYIPPLQPLDNTAVLEDEIPGEFEENDEDVKEDD